MTSYLQFTGWLLFILILYISMIPEIWWLEGWKLGEPNVDMLQNVGFWVFVHPFLGASSFFSHTHLLNRLGYLCTLVWPFPSVALLNSFGTCLICSSLLVSFLNLLRSYVQKEPQLCSGFVKIIEDFLLTTFEMSCFRRKDMLFGNLSPFLHFLGGSQPHQQLYFKQLLNGHLRLFITWLDDVPAGLWCFCGRSRTHGAHAERV